MSNVRRLFHAFVGLVWISIVYSICPSSFITTSDIQTAWRASKFVYDSDSKTGAVIPGTNFKIIADGEDEIIENKTPVKVFVAEYGKTTIIAYRGTDGTTQLVDQLLMSIKHFGGEKVTIDENEATIVKYFWKGYSQLYQYIQPYLDRRDHKYIITGHSLGGSMASIMSIMAVEEDHSVWEHAASSLITFGQPRTGDRVYAAKHDKLINGFRKLRFTNRNDPVPLLPLPLLPLPVHHSREIWMAKEIRWWNPKVYWKVCNEKDAKNCGFQRVTFPNVNDHLGTQYEKYILNLPTKYLDNRSGTHRSFRDALKETCNS